MESEVQRVREEIATACAKTWYSRDSDGRTVWLEMADQILAQLAKAEPIIRADEHAKTDAAVRLECQAVIAADNEEYFGRHKAELEQARADERAKVLKELFDAVDELELPIYTTSGSIQELCRRTILRKIRTFDQLKQGKEVKP